MKNKAVGIGEVVPGIVGKFRIKQDVRDGVIWVNDCFIITDSLLEKFRHVYPHFDKWLLKSELWYLANPKRRKKNHFRFLVNWMGRKK